MTQEGQNVTSEQNVTEWTTCHMVDNMSHIDELSHTEQIASPHGSDHRMFTPPKPPIPNDVP